MTPHPATLDVETLLEDCVERRLRRQGPGGQHRNKVETAVQLVHEPSGVSAEGNERRSQVENRREAVFRLRVKLALNVRSPIPPPTEPLANSDLWQSRIRDGKIECNERHHDFPAMLAEALDRLAIFDWEPSDAASSLGCTTSQLIKFLKKEHLAFELLNRHRQELGRKPMT